MQKMMNTWMGRGFIALVALVALLACGFSLLAPAPPARSPIAISQVIADAQDGKIASIEIQREDAHRIYATYRSQPGVRFAAAVPADQDIITLLQQAGVAMDAIDVHVAAAPAWGSPMDVASVLLPLAVMGAGFALFTRYARAAKEKQLQNPPKA